ncbi:MAG: MarR family winged helix-turn-helix transcriptional regulator [Gammaproteobacteria bacterium]
MRSLLRAYYWMDESMQNGLIQAGLAPRTRTQTMILVNISNGVMRAAELARILGVSRQAIQQQINELESEDLVIQVPDPDDRRAHRILFSEKGAYFMQIALGGLRNAEQLLSDRIGSEALSNMKQALTADWGPVLGETRAPGRKRSVS